MTVTITGTNYLQITSMDTTTAGGTWVGSTPAGDTGSYKEGAGSMCFVMKTAGTNVTTFTPTNPIDLSGIKHVRFWFLSIHGGLFTQVELGITGAEGTGYWVLATASEYPGGWYQCMIDVSKAVHSGTKPTMSSITDFVFRVTLTGGKNAVNFWLDSLIYCDGLVTYGDDAGGAFDFADIYTTGISNATGVISLYNGVYYLTGSIIIGDTGSNSTIFQAKNQLIVFQDKSTFVNAALYAINVVGGTGATQSIKFGEESGGVGINGCVIKCNSSTLAPEITATDTDVKAFGLYGCSFDTYGTVDLMAHSVTYTYEVLSCNFLNGVGQIQPNTMTFKNNFIVGGVHTGGSVLYESTSHKITYINYINNNRATEFAVAGTYGMTGDLFTGGTYDIHFSASTGNLIINCGGSPKANPSDAQILNDSTGTVTINNTVNVTINVKNTADQNVDGALVFLKAGSGGDYPYQVSVSIVSSGGVATVTHATHGLATDEYVEIAGVNQPEYNGVKQITWTGTGTYTYAISGAPTSPATGTPTSTFVPLFDTTVSGAVTSIMRYKTLDQPFTGRVRKSSGTPLYRQGLLSGTIENADYSTTVYLVDDA